MLTHSLVYIDMKSVSEKKSPLTREDWLMAAIQTLFESGIGSISIAQLANTLGVTRGSFYHHFSDREDLLCAMLNHWKKKWTVEVREKISALELSPVETLRALIKFIRERKAAAFDAPFRAWALHDPLARRALERVDSYRLAFIKHQFEAAGFIGLDAENRARMLLYYEMSDPAFFATQNPETETQLIDARLKLLLQQANQQTHAIST